jgi:hypothetical protein
MALPGPMGVVRFSAQELTFVEQSECEILTDADVVDAPQRPRCAKVEVLMSTT